MQHYDICKKRDNKCDINLEKQIAPYLVAKNDLITMPLIKIHL